MNTHRRRRAPLLALALAASPAMASGRTGEPRMSFLDNGVVRVGVDLSLGGAITWISESGSERNVVNSHDFGRQIQMSFYSGPVPYAPDGKEPAKAWRMLGWNPIQTGDVAGNPSRVTAHTNDGEELYVRCIPMHWPLDDEPAHATFETRIRLEGPTVRVTCDLRNARRDRTRYPARAQELPAVYTNAFLHRLVTYDGPHPFTGEQVRTIEKRWSSPEDLEAGSPWAAWQATEGWAALLDDEGWGLGVLAPGPLRFGGGFFGTPGAGGAKDASTGYLSPQRTEVLDADIHYRYRYALTLGTVEEIRRLAAAQPRTGWAPDYRFTNDRRHWTLVDCRDGGWPIEGELVVRLDGGDPRLIGPLGCWNAAEVPRLHLDAAFATGEDAATLFWMRHGDGGFTAENSLVFPVVSDGTRRVTVIQLAGLSGWEGTITRLRLDPASRGGEGREVRIRSLSLHPPARGK